MRYLFMAATAAALLCFCRGGTDAFSPKTFGIRRAKVGTSSTKLAAATTVATKPIAGMKPGTSGLRKKVEVWQGKEEENKYYVENFIQSLLNTAKANNDDNMLDT
mmetsp:Transcript_6017/g.13358  ORF Transcript_6017/g.13358 Transcript_6017/m.13358 type:complete len:105 (+) Transcript_6017:3035-3349(+)